METKNKKLGKLGEQYFRDFLDAEKVMYWTNYNYNYNITDFLICFNNKITFLEVNTKTAYKGKSTGKNTKTINLYKDRMAKYNTDYFMAFIDVSKGTCYGAYLSELLKTECSYIKNEYCDVTLFDIKHMKFLFNLTAEQSSEIIKLTETKNTINQLNLAL